MRGERENWAKECCFQWPSHITLLDSTLISYLPLIKQSLVKQANYRNLGCTGKVVKTTPYLAQCSCYYILPVNLPPSKSLTRNLWQENSFMNPLQSYWLSETKSMFRAISKWPFTTTSYSSCGAQDKESVKIWMESFLPKAHRLTYLGVSLIILINIAPPQLKFNNSSRSQKCATMLDKYSPWPECCIVLAGLNNSEPLAHFSVALSSWYMNHWSTVHP